MSYSVIIGILIPFACTTLGSAVVFLFKANVSDLVLKLFLGLAAGIMVSASFFSLLLPSIEKATEIKWMPAAAGVLLGALFLALLDKVVPHFHPEGNIEEGLKSRLKRSTKMLLAVTLHNIPEGMAVGLLYGVALQSGSGVSLAAALALAIGIGIQNIPEGAAISLPLKQDGMNNLKSFTYGMLSGLVEPIGAFVALGAVGVIGALMPWFLGFAAGCMLYVVVEEIIPEMHLDSQEHSLIPSFGFIIGFIIMMILDVALG